MFSGLPWLVRKIFRFVHPFPGSAISARWNCGRDSAGNQASVGNGRVANLSGGISFWPVDREEVQWLPNEFVPQRGSVISAPFIPLGASRVFAVSVPELGKAGLSVQRLAALDLTVGFAPENTVRVSPLYRLAHRSAPLAPEKGVCSLR
jgi:hypothetical protein